MQIVGDTKAAPTVKVEAVAALAVGAVALLMLAVQVAEVVANAAVIEWGADYLIVTDAGRRWVETGVFYLPEQLAAPYTWPGPWVLYPPPSLFLFVPFAYLPAVLWWAVPLSLTAWVVWRHRPRPLAWAVILFCLANPTTISAIAWGNPLLWLVAFAALGTLYGWPAVLVFLKPSLFPFALIGIWRRSWWAALGVCAVVSLAFLPMWLDYLTVVRNAQAPQGWFGYSTAQIPAMLIPVVALLSRAGSPAGRWSWRSARHRVAGPVPPPSAP
jgi:hypothetical protein